MRNSTNYNEIVGVLKTGELYVLTDTFQYGDGFKGATRYTMTTLSQDEIDMLSSLDYVMTNNRDMWVYEAKNNLTDDSLEEWAKNQIDNAEGYFPYDDDSFRDDADEAYNKLTDKQKKKLNEVFGEKGKDFVDYTCVSCGRAGKVSADDFKLILNPKLINVINEYEEQ